MDLFAPRVSVLVLVYNQEATVDAAVESIFAQDCEEPFEILLSDDASTDGSFARLRALAARYDGPHQVVVRRNPVNLGIGEHYNAAVAAARGELLFTAAGDDISLPHRVRCVLAAWDDRRCQPDLLASHVVSLAWDGSIGELLRVDDLERWHGVHDWCRQRPYVVGAAHAFTKRLWQRFGPLNPDVVYEDQAITLRALLGGGAITVDAPLVRYRQGGVSAADRHEDVRTFVARTRTQVSRGLAEQRQLLRDAETAGCVSPVQQAMAPLIGRTRFVASLLDAPDAWAAWRLAWAEAGVKTRAWRLRKWLYLRMPRVGTTIRRLQTLRKQSRNPGPQR